MKIRNKETMSTLYEPVRWLLVPNGCVTAREKKKKNWNKLIVK